MASLLFSPLTVDAVGYEIRASSGHVLWTFHKLQGLEQTWNFLQVNSASLCCRALHWSTSHSPPRYYCKRCDKRSPLLDPAWDEEDSLLTLEEHLATVMREWGHGPLEAQVLAIPAAEAILTSMARVAEEKARPTQTFEVIL